MKLRALTRPRHLLLDMPLTIVTRTHHRWPLTLLFVFGSDDDGAACPR